MSTSVEPTKRAITSYYDTLRDRYLSELDRDDTTGRIARASITSVVNLVTRIYTKSLEGPSNPLVLDYGCGNGRWAAAYVNSGFTVIGVDLSLWMLKSATKRLIISGGADRFHAVRADTSRLPFRAQSIAIAHLYGVIEHLVFSDLLVTIKELAKVLGSQGLAAIDVPQRGSMSYFLIAAASTLRLSRVPLFHFYDEHETSEIISEARRQHLQLIHRQPTGYWYPLFPFNRISRLPLKVLQRLSRSVFRNPLGLLLILSKSRSQACEIEPVTTQLDDCCGLRSRTPDVNIRGEA